MKLEWGKKVNCPACALPFYSMQKSALTCPNCGNKFDISELNTKKLNTVSLDLEADFDDKIPLSDFVFDDSTDEIGLHETADLEDKEVLDDMKLVDKD